MSTTYVGGVNVTAISDKLNEVIATLEQIKATNPTLTVPKNAKSDDFRKAKE